jgi:hypothetical protein
MASVSLAWALASALRAGHDHPAGNCPVWGEKISGQGVNSSHDGFQMAFRWLSKKLSTVPRKLMECRRDFTKKCGGRQEGFMIPNPRGQG